MCSQAEGSVAAAAPVVSIHPVLVRPATTAAAPSTVPSRILLIEDHADTATMMRRLLLRRGYDVTVATTCAEALAAARVQRFDLVLSDLGLPDGSGLELIGQLSHLTKAPAVALSGYGMPDDARKSLAAGFLVHLTKPVAVERLWSTLDHVLTPRATAEAS